MNKLVRRLLSGASLATLQLCAGTAARAAGTTINTTRGAFSVTAGQAFDFIEVTNTGHITGNLTNEGTVGPWGIAVEVQTGGSVTGSIINAAGAHITATQAGIDIQTGVNIGGISNAGHILVSATTSGNRSVTGINYHSTTSAHLTNTGDIAVKLSGRTTGSAGLTVTGFGVKNHANGGAAAVHQLATNSGGSVAVTVRAVNSHQSGTNHAIAAVADDGIAQFAGNFTSDVAELTNSGSISLNAKATATATGAGAGNGAHAAAYNAMVQSAAAGGPTTSANLSITNTGTVLLAAAASWHGNGISNGAQASAVAALDQQSFGGGSATESIVNNGTVTLNVNASLSASGGAAAAKVTDIAVQLALGAKSASQSIDNSGTIVAKATALAHVGFSGTANASLSGLFNQAALGISTLATQEITNSGNITISAKANITASDTGKAGAKLDELIHQSGAGGGSVSQSITNSGVITVTLGAKAKGFDATAQASSCGCHPVIDQFVTGSTISQGFANTGSISLALNATAIATARADASVAIGTGLLNQEGHASANVTQNLSNKNLTLTLAAKATGSNVMATADADAPLIKQFATGVASNQTFTNSGSLTLGFDATAKGTSQAAAAAFLNGAAIEQEAFTETVAQTLSNAGSIGLNLTAVATATAGQAHAGATATDALIKQFTAGVSTGQTLDNSGSLTVGVKATALAKTHAQAVASLSGGGILQEAHATTVAQALTNSGPVTFDLSAKATGSKATATADPNLPLLRQFATGNKINQSLTNSGSVAVTFDASAKGGSGGALARMDGFAWQIAQSATAVTQTFNNSSHGSLSVAISAKAAMASATGQVRASGELNSPMLVQAARDLNHLVQSLTNAGSIALQARASATNGGPGTAVANAGGTIAEQSMTVPTTAPQHNATMSNSGTITIDNLATAHAAKDADAEAFTEIFDQKSRLNHAASGAATLAQSNGGHIAITLTANAFGGTSANASAGGTIFHQEGSSIPNLVESITNSGTVALRLSTLAKITGAAGTHGSAEASFDGELIARQHAHGPDNASVSFSNSGSVAIQAVAVATGRTRAEATAELALISQFASNNDVSGTGNVTMNVTNSGTIDASFSLKASGAPISHAKATIIGVSQTAESVNLTDTFTNSGTLEIAGSVVSDPTVTAPPADRFAHEAQIRMTGVYAAATGRSLVRHTFSATSTISAPATLSATLANSGTIDVSASAAGPRALAEAYGAVLSAKSQVADFSTHATAAGHRTATSHTQRASREVSGLVVNSGTISVSASASGERAIAGAVLIDSSDPQVTVTNSGLLAANVAGATATAYGLHIAAYSSSFRSAETTATAAPHTRTALSSRQSGFAPAGAIGSKIDNSGSLVVSAAGTAHAEADGIALDATVMSAEVDNSGDISVSAVGLNATAAGIKIFAAASVTHVVMHSHGTSGVTTSNVTTNQVITPVSGNKFTGTVDNSGTIAVSAAGTGVSKANGIEIDADTMTGKVLNEGVAWAYASGKTATANAVLLQGASFGGTVDSSGTLTAIAHGTKATAAGLNIESTGAVNAAVTIHDVNAIATGGTAVAKGVEVSGATVAGTLTVDGTVAALASGSVSANAQAIAIDPTTISGAFANTGAISATATGPGAIAQGIVVVGGAGNYAVDNDGGSISAIQNGSHGTAIDLSGAPSSVTVGLNSGSIYGNIVENAAGNAITVANGNTLYDGAINPSGALIGSLTIAASGTLTLAPGSVVNVGTYSQTGGIAFKALPDPTTVAAIHAANATISGPATLDLDLAGGPYGFSTTYKLLFTTNAINGTWSVVAPDQAFTFFSASGQYTAAEADIVLTRTGFDAITGLTDNETSVGKALETIYETSGGTGPLGPLFAALFNLSSSQYTDALDSLSGEAAGEMSAVDQSAAQSFLDQINNHLGGSNTGDGTVASLLDSGSQPLAANTAPTGVSPAQAWNLSGTHVWGGGFQSSNAVARTASGPRYTSHQSGLLAGIDVPLDSHALVGIAGSYSTGDLKTEKFFGFGTFTAAQIAGYGRFNWDSGLYASGDVSYGSFTNKLSRFVSIPGLASGNVHGSFDSQAWGLYGETGWRFNPSDWATSLTPYAAISYLDAKSDGYTETGTFMAPLTIGSSTSKATSSYLGVKLATDWQLESATVTPHLTAAWQHDFTKNAWEVSAAFAAVPTVGFGLTGKDLARDGAYVDGGLTFHVDEQADILIDYQGRFTSDRSDNAFLARANIKF